MNGLASHRPDSKPTLTLLRTSATSMLCLCSSTTQKAKSSARDSASGEKAVPGAAGKDDDKAQTELGLGLEGRGGSVRVGTSRRRRLASCPPPSAATAAAAGGIGHGAIRRLRPLRAGGQQLLGTRRRRQRIPANRSRNRKRTRRRRRSARGGRQRPGRDQSLLHGRERCPAALLADAAATAPIC